MDLLAPGDAVLLHTDGLVSTGPGPSTRARTRPPGSPPHPAVSRSWTRATNCPPTLKAPSTTVAVLDSPLT
ncbi:hypothetical protein [Streptomyces wuyuanensis]|uniref:hypothetical protein n=1 Tax=Streptomyces wuyuanensis TaxID=1196353 RepID=UPI0037F8AB19